MNATATMETSEFLDPPRGYKALILSALLICSIGTILSLTLLIATTLPLLWRRRRKRYSTYNLYLAYLAIPDLIISSFVVHLILTSHTASFDPKTIEDGDDGEESQFWMFDHPVDHNIYALCVSANLYTNAFLVYEIYRLLKDSNRRKRHRPPSIAKATKQAMVSYGVGVFLFFLEYFLSDKFDGDSKSIKIWFGFYQAFSFIVCVGIPLSALVFASWMIHREGLIESTGSMYGGRLRVLVIYFARIVANYLLLWGPASASYMLYWSLGPSGTKVMAYVIFLVLNGSQPIINFVLSMTKPDAHKLITDLFTCGYCKSQQDGKFDRESSTFSVDPYLGADTTCIESLAFRASATSDVPNETNETTADPAAVETSSV
mmetsp:Transcript_6417/g.15577  ORF Transcript_6417/g.15577 Transcript_6417/m.15577 type:complete len:375 (+) Transcript_6417:256-1380(+)